ncbi:ANKRD50 [Symbiodinium sp. KB8]|nr:ANKRD50 [Symbiodinium sp. KB8]
MPARGEPKAFVLQLQQGQVREKSYMQISEEKMGIKWSDRCMDRSALPITHLRRHLSGGAPDPRAVEKARQGIKAEVERVSEWFEPAEGDTELHVAERNPFGECPEVFANVVAEVEKEPPKVTVKEVPIRLPSFDDVLIPSKPKPVIVDAPVVQDVVTPQAVAQTPPAARKPWTPKTRQEEPEEPEPAPVVVPDEPDDPEIEVTKPKPPPPAPTPQASPKKQASRPEPTSMPAATETEKVPVAAVVQRGLFRIKEKHSEAPKSPEEVEEDDYERPASEGRRRLNLAEEFREAIALAWERALAEVELVWAQKHPVELEGLERTAAESPERGRIHQLIGMGKDDGKDCEELPEADSLDETCVGESRRVAFSFFQREQIPVDDLPDELSITMLSEQILARFMKSYHACLCRRPVLSETSAGFIKEMRVHYQEQEAMDQFFTVFKRSNSVGSQAERASYKVEGTFASERWALKKHREQHYVAVLYNSFPHVSQLVPPSAWQIDPEHRFYGSACQVVPKKWAEDQWIEKFLQVNGHRSDYIASQVASLQPLRWLLELQAQGLAPQTQRPLFARAGLPTPSAEQQIFITRVLNQVENRVEELTLPEKPVIYPLTGGPGTGKTLCVDHIIDSALQLEARVLVLAPTGKLATRLLGRPGIVSMTIAKLLVVGRSGEAHATLLDAAGGGSFVFDTWFESVKAVTFRSESVPLEAEDIEALARASDDALALIPSTKTRLLSGEEVASMPLEELSDVKALKQQLHRLHCLPARFSQRLSLCGNLLDDTAKLDSPMELELVLLPYAATSETQVDEFTTASAAGSVSQVEALLQKPLHPDVVDVRGRSPLGMACWRGKLKVARVLLEAGADKNFANNRGNTALILASGRGYLEVARLLLNAGADKNLANNDGVTALMAASRKGRSQRGCIEVVSLLLEASADKDSADNEGKSAIMHASHEGRTSVVRLLLEAGADKNSVDRRGSTALMAAAVGGHAKLLCLLLEAAADRDLSDSDGVTALMGASRLGHTKVVHLLLDAGADQNLADNGGTTALKIACQHGHVEVVQLLLEADAEKNFDHNHSHAALLAASAAGHVEVVRLLVEAGADKNFATHDGVTALILASERGYVEVVRLLVKAGADKHFANNDGVTALMAASKRSRVEVVGLLLEAGTEKNTADNLGFTALMMASLKGHAEVVRLLLEANSDKSSAQNDIADVLRVASSNKKVREAVVQFTLKADVSLEFCSSAL